MRLRQVYCGGVNGTKAALCCEHPHLMTSRWQHTAAAATVTFPNFFASRSALDWRVLYTRLFISSAGILTWRMLPPFGLTESVKERKIMFSEMWHRVVWEISTDVSKDYAAPIFDLKSEAEPRIPEVYFSQPPLSERWVSSQMHRVFCTHRKLLSYVHHFSSLSCHLLLIPCFLLLFIISSRWFRASWLLFSVRYAFNAVSLSCHIYGVSFVVSHDYCCAQGNDKQRHSAEPRQWGGLSPLAMSSHGKKWKTPVFQ
jgi:hypothetical protein